ncbi:MAG TPA: hypothetical protein VLH94_02260 [Spirochaetia bacterium]|nr:hypothetical protein [Spirochaetia bacterium]
MAENKIVGYKNIFGFVLPDWVDESTIRMIVTFLLSSAVMMFVLIFVIWPKFSEINDLKVTVSSRQTQLESLKSSKGGFDKLNEQIPESTQSLILQAIPQIYTPENTVYLLRNISNETGVTIVSYTLPSGVLYEAEKTNIKSGSDSENVVTFVSYPIKLSVVAPVSSLLSFIKKVETSLPFGVVSDLGMQEVGKLAKSVAADKSVKMELEVKYYQTILKQVDIAKIKPFSDADMALVKTIEGFSRFSQTGGASEIPPASNTSGNLFGF